MRKTIQTVRAENVVGFFVILGKFLAHVTGKKKHRRVSNKTSTKRNSLIKYGTNVRKRKSVRRQKIIINVYRRSLRAK